jgi:hypothetical protein
MPNSDAKRLMGKQESTCNLPVVVFSKYICSTLHSTASCCLFQSDVDVPLLGEIVSSGPQGVLIKEAKVTKPSIVPLISPEESLQVCIYHTSKNTVFQCVDSCSPVFNK